MTYYFLNDYLNALLEWKDRTMPLRNDCKSVDIGRTSQTLINIGTCYKIFNDFDQAIYYLNQALIIVENSHKILNENHISSCIAISACYRGKNDFINAESILFKALSMLEKMNISKNEPTGKVYIELGFNSIFKKEYEQSVKYLNIAKKIIEKNNPELLALLYRNFAVLYLESGLYQKSIESAEKALYFYKLKKVNNDYLLSNIYENFGLALSYSGNSKEALRYYNKTYIIGKDKKISYDFVSNILENISGAYGRLNMLDSALYYINKSIESAHSLSGFNLSGEIKKQTENDFVKKTMIRKLQMRGKFLNRKYFEKNDIKYLLDSEKSFSSADSLVMLLRKEIRNKDSKIILGIDLDTVYKYAIDNAYNLWKVTGKSKYKERAYFYISENKAAVFSESKEELSNVWNLLSDDLRVKYLDILDQLNSNSFQKQYAVLKNDSQAYHMLNTEFISLTNKKEKLEKEIKINHPDFFERINNVLLPKSIKELQSKLENNNAILEYYIDEKVLYTYAITKKSIYIDKFESHYDLNSLFSDFNRELMMYNNLTGVKDYSKIIYPILFSEKLNVFLDVENISRLIVIRDKNMNMITFAPIMTGDDFRKDYLIYKYSFSYAFNNKNIWKNNALSTQKEYTFAGFATNYDKFTLNEINKDSIYWEGHEPPDLQELTQSVTEVNRISKLFESKTWIGNECTLHNFQENAGKFKILHLSLHSILAENNDQQNAIIFQKTENSKSFILKSEIISRMRLNNNLTVLSACSTADGSVISAEGIRSIASNFAIAGSSAVIATQWQTYEGQTADILEGFYIFLRQGYPKDVALQKAQLKYLKNAPEMFLAASNWSNFTLIGDSQFIPFNSLKTFYYKYFTWSNLIILFSIILFIYIIFTYIHNPKRYKE